jgi:hypothetical protein
MEQEIDWMQEIRGRGYMRIDWERDRQKKRDFWAALEGMSSGVALMVDWHWIFGSAVDVVRPFLELTGEKAEDFPCPADPPCECRHAIMETSRGELVADCCCDHNHCGRYQIEPEDLLFHGLRLDRFGEAIRVVLGFDGPSAAPYVSAALREVATYTAVAVPVYLSLGNAQELLRELTRLLGLREGPFLVVTPTGGSWSPEVEALARPHGGGHISLSSVLRVDAPNRFVCTGAIGSMLAEFTKRLASLRNTGATLVSIHREIARVGKDVVELRSAKQRLEKMLADGMFAFTRKVDAASFKVLCTILAEGDVSKASRTLGEPEDTVRAVVRRWAGKGKEYNAMLELVRWRKKVGRREKVPLNDALLHNRAETVDYPGLLSDVLDGLLSMTEENWAERCEELAELLRPLVR